MDDFDGIETDAVSRRYWAQRQGECAHRIDLRTAYSLLRSVIEAFVGEDLLQEWALTRGTG
jgi:hypothetical protein